MAESTINTGQPSVDTNPDALLPDKEMLKLCLDRWTAARDWRANKESQWQKWYKLYRSYAERKTWPHNVNLFIPLVWSTVESFLPRLVVQKPTILVESRGDENIDAAAFHRQLLEYQWQELKIPKLIEEWEKEALIYGTGIVKVGWETKKMTRKFNSPTGEGGEVAEMIETDFVVKDRPFISLVAIENFYPEPGSPDVVEARFVIERSKKTFWELEALGKELGWNMGVIKKLKDKQFTDTDVHGEDSAKLERETTFGTSDSKMAKHEAKIWEFEVLEYWEDGRYCIFLTDPEVVLKNDYNPFWHGNKPYLRIVDNALPGEFYGVGEPEVLQSLAIELNALHNLRLENVERSVFQMFKVRIGAPITQSMTKFKPQGIIWVNQQDDIEPLFQGQPSIALSREEDGLRTWAQIATGANDNFQGQQADKTETATGASILAQAAASRVGMKFFQLATAGLEPLGEMLIALNEQHMKPENAISIVGPEGQAHVKLGPAQLATGGALLSVKLDIGATDPINREMKLQKDMNLLSIFMQLYGDPNHPAIQALIKRILDLGDIHIDEELLAVRPDPANVEASGGQAGGQAPAEAGPSTRDALGVDDGG
ncbi:hypothetical protein LCGC14_1565160 [marine sediment metagenome]|uniref:Portal protein n=1 Tax=marine sediment metagenome TaxID=412755 RepID=A0A0F9LLX4_9ZZZZ